MRGQASGFWLALALALAVLPNAQVRAAEAEPRLLAQIEAFDRKLVQAEAALMEGDAQVRAISREVASAQTAQDAALEAYQQTARKLGRRLGVLTRMGPSAELTALAGVRDLAMLVDEQQLMGAIAKHDRALWAAHHASGQQMQQSLASLQERAQALELAQSERRANRDALAQSRQRKDRTLQALRRSKKQRDVHGELQLAQVRLAAVVAQPSGGQQGGAQSEPSNGPAVRRARLALPWPASGRVRVGYGQHTETIFGTATFHNGWDIAAARGSRVNAVASGVVAFADWLHGYGQVAIVEHPGGYHTVHGHLGRLLVTQGQRVRTGQLLGTVGDTGSLRGTVLYFEIRHRGVPEDPRLYLRRRGP